jgi:hypothetical protein
MSCNSTALGLYYMSNELETQCLYKLYLLGKGFM